MSPQSAIAEALNGVELGVPQTYQNLTVFPLLAREPNTANYLTLDEALALGTLVVTEIGESGVVPELNVLSRGPEPVLLVDGEELVGAKQNRVLNLTILVDAASSTTIPVSCVEAGRWSRVSRHFASSSRAQFAEGRAAKMRSVTESMRKTGSRRSHQGEVWQHIEEKAARLDAGSGTSAMSAIFERMSGSIEDFVGAFTPADRQAGAVFALNGQIAGLDLFDAPDTRRKVAPKLIRSYAVDALDRSGESREPAIDAARRFLTDVAGLDAKEFPAAPLVPTCASRENTSMPRRLWPIITSCT
jgi:hypothetical protein